MDRKQMKQLFLLGCGTMVCAMAGLAADKEQPILISSQRTAAAPAVPTNTVPAVISIDGKAVLSLQLPAGGGAITAGGRTVVQASGTPVLFQLWQADKAKTIDDAVGLTGGLLVKEDVKDFRASATNSIAVAGSPAKQLVGTGTEVVDDGVQSQVEAIVFSAGGKIFVACVHGELPDAARQKAMLAVLQTAKQP